MKNYYEILGIPEDSIDSDIKKAYRSLSLKYHPDRNPSEEAKTKILDVNEAYETLSDAGRRKQYDMQRAGGGDNGFPPGFPPGFGGGFPPGFGGGFPPGFGGGEHDDIQNLLNMMFGGGGGGPANIRIFHSSGAGNPFAFANMHKPEPIEKTIEIELEQAFTGATIEVSYDRVVIANNVKTNHTDTIPVVLRAGIQDGETLILSERGHFVREHKGDLRIIVKIKPHAIYTREGSDLHLNRTITLKESLCGFVLEFLHLNGKMLRLTHSATTQIIKPRSSKTINGFGMQQGTSNLVIHFDISFPDSLTEDQINSLASIL